MPTVAEPEGLPSFSIYEGRPLYGFDQRPTTGPCTWAPHQRHLSGFDDSPMETVYVPSSFIVTVNGRTCLTLVQRDVERCGFPHHSSWARLLHESLEQFTTTVGGESWFGRNLPDSDRVHTAIAYGFLQTSAPTFDGPPVISTNFRTVVMPTIYRSPALLETMYAWAIPHAQEAWRRLPIPARVVYRDILFHAEHYLATYNDAAERAYLARLQRGECFELAREGDMRYIRSLARPGYPANRCTPTFTRVGPNSQPNNFRKLEAWFFRRFREGLPVATAYTYVNRLTGDLLHAAPARNN